jgi:hypothetical protein
MRPSASHRCATPAAQRLAAASQPRPLGLRPVHRHRAALPPPRRRAGRRAAAAAAAAAASASAAEQLARGRAKFDAGDRGGALRLWEEAAADASATTAQRVAAYYNATCVHASFGDVELAQITLRAALLGGLDFAAAVEDPAAVDPALVTLVASQQVRNRLRKFAEAAAKKAAAPAPPPPPPRAAAGGGAGSGAARPGLLADDMSGRLQTDLTGLDASALGIVRRVALLLAALSGLGVVLFFLGQKFMFVE